MRCAVDGARVERFFSFGKLPLGNAFPTRADAVEELFELELGFCNSCSLVQQTSPPPARSLERDYENYRYVPTGSTLKEHYYELGKKLVKDLGITIQSFVVDIGSNDGSLLGHIRANSSARVLGVEPAKEISETAKRGGVPTLNAFFTSEVAQHIIKEKGFADVVCCTQVLQHVPHVTWFMNNVYALLRPSGVFVYEGRYIADTIEKNSYDTCYHEMLYFFSFGSLVKLFAKAGLTIFSIERTDVYGGSLRVYARKSPQSFLTIDPVFPMLEAEHKLGLDLISRYRVWGEDVRNLRHELVMLLKNLKKQDKKIAGYGAPSTSATLLNYCGIGTETLEYVVDDSPLKQGLFTPGTHIPIVSAKHFQENAPDYLLLLAWRLKNEILDKVAWYRDMGGKVIVPLPQVEVI